MKKIKSVGVLLAVLAVCYQQAHASPTIIDFDPHEPALDGSRFVKENDVLFHLNAAGFGVFSPSSGACCNVNYNGTSALYVNGSYGSNLANLDNANVQMTISNTYHGNGAGFLTELQGFDASTYWNGATGKLDVIGRSYNGDTVTTITTSFDIDSTWQHYILPSTFKNLMSVEFRDSQSGEFLSAPGFGLDNIAYTVQLVPEPQTYLMLLAGLGLLGFAARGKKESAL